MPRARKNTQPVRAPHGLEYGERKALEDSQRVRPLPQTPTPGAAAPTAAPTRGVAPADVTGLTAPSARPDEPIQTGLSTGPGPGPGATLGARRGVDEPAVAELRALYARRPTPGLRRLLELTEAAYR